MNTISSELVYDFLDSIAALELPTILRLLEMFDLSIGEKPTFVIGLQKIVQYAMENRALGVVLMAIDDIIDVDWQDAPEPICEALYRARETCMLIVFSLTTQF